ncbi:MAG: sialidase family protein [Pirellulales bacterium]
MPMTWLPYVLQILLLCALTAPVSGFEIAYPTFGLSGEIAFGNLAKHTDGRLFCALAQKREGRLDSIHLTSTRDSGKSWSDAVKVMDIVGKPGYIADPNILVSPDGVRVFATYVPMEDGKFSRSEFLVSHSANGLDGWSQPAALDLPYNYKAGKVHVPIWLDDTTAAMAFAWDVPAQEKRATDTEQEMFCRAALLISNDAGKTWKPGGDIILDIKPIGADEPAIVKLVNGDIFGVVRTSTERPYETRSHDSGQTWDPPKPSQFYGYNSPSALLRLTDNRILRVWNNSPQHRYPLVASISTDECQTWSDPKTIIDRAVDAAGKENLARACYPSIAQADDGTIVVVWWEVNDGRSRIGTARFAPDWVIEDSEPR